MIKLLLIAALVMLGWRLVFGQWPWDSARRIERRGGKIERARRLLGVRRDADRLAIETAHRRLIGRVHPDRGGDAAQVQRANEARDLLLAERSKRAKGRE